MKRIIRGAVYTSATNLFLVSKDAGTEGLGLLGIGVGCCSGTRIIVLGLGKGVAPAVLLQPVAALRRSALQVKLIKVLELECLLDITLVVGSLLVLILCTDSGVLGLSQASGDVRLVGELTLLQLQLDGKKETNHDIEIFSLAQTGVARGLCFLQ